MTRVGPLAAFFVVLALDVLAFAAQGGELGGAVVLGLGLAATSGTVRPLRRLLLAAPFVVLVTLFLYALLVPGEALARAGPVALSSAGVEAGLAVSARFVVLVLAALWAVEVVAARDVLDVAARLRFVTLGLTVRASATLAADARRIREAQAMRGLGAQGLATYRSYLVPMFVLSLRRAQTSGRALAMAGLGGPRRTHLRGFPWYRTDWAWIAVALATATLAAVAFGGIL